MRQVNLVKTNISRARYATQDDSSHEFNPFIAIVTQFKMGTSMLPKKVETFVLECLKPH